MQDVVESVMRLAEVDVVATVGLVDVMQEVTLSHTRESVASKSSVLGVLLTSPSHRFRGHRYFA